MKTVFTTEEHKQICMCEKCREKSEDHALTGTGNNVVIISIKDEIYRKNTNFKKRPFMTLCCALKSYLHSRAVN